VGNSSGSSFSFYTTWARVCQIVADVIYSKVMHRLRRPLWLNRCLVGNYGDLMCQETGTVSLDFIHSLERSKWPLYRIDWRMRWLCPHHHNICSQTSALKLYTTKLKGRQDDRDRDRATLDVQCAIHSLSSLSAAPAPSPRCALAAGSSDWFNTVAPEGTDSCQSTEGKSSNIQSYNRENRISQLSD